MTAAGTSLAHAPKIASPVRVLYATDGFAPYVVGGMQSVARRHIDTLVASGFEIISISSRDGGSLGEIAWRNISIPWPRRSLWQTLSPWRYAADLERFSSEVARIIDDTRPDVVYSEGPLIANYLRRPRDQRAPTIFHPHGLEMFQRKGSRIEDARSWPLRGIVRFHARNADVVISQSKHGALPRLLMDQCGVPAHRLCTLPNAVSLDQQIAVSARPRPIGARFLFIGRDEPRKGLAVLLKAVEGLNGATLDVVGHCNLPRGTSSRVRAHGVIKDREHIREFFGRADFVVVPSFAEGMPTVILEAFAQAVPVIATDVGASADAVRAGETGFLIPPGDAVALRQAMIQAMALDGTRYSRLSRNCLELARTRYAPSTTRDQLVALIQKLAPPQQPRSQIE